MAPRSENAKGEDQELTHDRADYESLVLAGCDESLSKGPQDRIEAKRSAPIAIGA